MKRPDRVDPRAIARAILASALAVAIASPATARAQAAATSDGHALAAGPIHDRHEIMEGMGLSAKAIGAALKSGKPADAAKPAEDIAGKVDAFKLCKAQDKVVAHVQKANKAKAGKPAATPACADPGPFVYTPPSAAPAVAAPSPAKS